MGPGADSEEKREPVSDIDIAVADSLKVLDLKRPIREGLGYADRQAPRNEESDRGPGSPAGRHPAPHLGCRHRIPLDPRGRTCSMTAVTDQFQ